MLWQKVEDEKGPIDEMIRTLNRYVDVVVTPKNLSDQYKLEEFRRGKIKGAITPQELDKIDSLINKRRDIIKV